MGLGLVKDVGAYILPVCRLVEAQRTMCWYEYIACTLLCTRKSGVAKVDLQAVSKTAPMSSLEMQPSDVYCLWGHAVSQVLGSSNRLLMLDQA